MSYFFVEVYLLLLNLILVSLVHSFIRSIKVTTLIAQYPYTTQYKSYSTIWLYTQRKDAILITDLRPIVEDHFSNELYLCTVQKKESIFKNSIQP